MNPHIEIRTDKPQELLSYLKLTLASLFKGARVQLIEPMQGPPPITPLEMSENDIELSKRIAKRLGFRQTAYTSSSGLWGLFCLPDHSTHRHGCVIKTKEFGLMFVADLEDMQLHDLAAEERKALA